MKTFGGGLGCGAALAVALVLLAPAYLGLALGGSHCEPVPECRRSIELAFLVQAAAILVGATLVGLALRWSVNRLAVRAGEEAASVRFIAGVCLLALVVVGVAIWAGFRIMDLLLT